MKGQSGLSELRGLHFYLQLWKPMPPIISLLTKSSSVSGVQNAVIAAATATTHAAQDEGLGQKDRLAGEHRQVFQGLEDRKSAEEPALWDRLPVG